VQGSWSSQSVALPGVQLPAVQVSPVVQALPSVHGVVLGFGANVQLPVDVLQTPALRQKLAGAPQTTGSAPPHAPFVQLSVRVQALPSLHPAPFGLAGSEHRPLDGSHTPALWHWSDAVQTVGVPGVQLPLRQLSPTVHASESALHVAPFVFGGFEHAPVVGLQLPASWHWSDAVQVRVTPFVQMPL
jgi:hypothetical protein